MRSFVNQADMMSILNHHRVNSVRKSLIGLTSTYRKVVLPSEHVDWVLGFEDFPVVQPTKKSEHSLLASPDPSI